ncbi:MAG: glycosyltransferase family 4 protein [Acidobacteriota bacterium]
MQTLHVDSGREMRGGQWQALYLVERLTDAVLLARAGSPLYQEALRRKLDVRALTLRRLTAAAKQADLVHVHDARSHTLAAMVGVVPLVVSRRVAFPVKRGFFSLWKYARAALYVAVSKYVAARLLDAGIRDAKIRVVHDGVPIPEIARPQANRVIALASKPVEIPGISVDLTSDLWQDLSTASVFVYKSDMEGLGSGVLAAMAAGVPVVASNVGGLSEIVESGKTGFLVGDGDFATPVQRLLKDAELAAQMARAAREWVQQEFSVERMVEKTVRAYREVLG